MATRSTDTTHAPAVEVRAAAFGYQGRTVLSGVDFALEPGDMLALIGPNGGGKSTLLKGLLHLVSQSGELRISGRPPKQARRACGYVPQVDGIDPDFPISVLGVALMGVGRRTGPALWPRRRDRETARQALRRMRLDGQERCAFNELSGGQRQRALVARALAGTPSVLLLDEPLSATDSASTAAITKVLRELRGDGTTVVLSTHDHEFARRECSHALLLNGIQHAFGQCEHVLESPELASCYGHVPAVSGIRE